jgi:hypothetical protein
MSILSDPEPRGLLKAVSLAIQKLQERPVDRWAQHRRVRLLVKEMGQL